MDNYSKPIKRRKFLNIWVSGGFLFTLFPIMKSLPKSFSKLKITKNNLSVSAENLKKITLKYGSEFGRIYPEGPNSKWIKEG